MYARTIASAASPGKLASVDDLIRAESSQIVGFLPGPAGGGDNAIAERFHPLDDRGAHERIVLRDQDARQHEMGRGIGLGTGDEFEQQRFGLGEGASFGNAGYRLRDLNKIQEAFVSQLLGMYHQRVAYPQSKVVEIESRRAAGGGGTPA